MSELNVQIETLINKKVNSSSPLDEHFVQKVDFLSHEWDNFKQSWLPALAEHEVLLSDIDVRIAKLETMQPVRPQSMSSLSPKLFADITMKERAVQAHLDALETAAEGVEIPGLLSSTVQSLALQVTNLQDQINQSATTSSVVNCIPDSFHGIGLNMKACPQTRSLLESFILKRVRAPFYPSLRNSCHALVLDCLMI